MSYEKSRLGNKREKKISIKFYLNKDVKSRSEIDGRVLYPAYVRVIFDKKSTKFRLSGWVDEAFESDFSEGKIFENETRIISEQLKRIVRYEEKAHGDNFTLNGLGDRLRLYNFSLLTQITNQLSQEVDQLLANFLVHNKFITAKEESISERLTLLREYMPNFTPRIFQSIFVSGLISMSGIIPTPYSWLIESDRPKFIERVGKEGESLIAENSASVIHKFIYIKGEDIKNNLSQVAQIIDSFAVEITRNPQILSQLPDGIKVNENLINISF